MTTTPTKPAARAPVRAADPRLARLADAFESLTRPGVPALARLYADDARFADPFNDVRGRAAVETVYAHMFEQVDDPRFVVGNRIVDGDLAFMDWTLEFGKAGERTTIVGCTRLHFDDDGLVAEHLDFWDPAAQLYERVPVLGTVLRTARRRLAAPAPQRREDADGPRPAPGA